jgi:two-component system chemotaxis sensor kinase CheA
MPPEALAEFFAEVGEYLEDVARLVLEVTDRSHPGIQELYRKLHTVKGNSGMVGLSPLQETAHQMEDVVKAIRDGKAVMDEATRRSLADGTSRMLRILAAVGSGSADGPTGPGAADVCAPAQAATSGVPPVPRPEPHASAPRAADALPPVPRPEPYASAPRAADALPPVPRPEPAPAAAATGKPATSRQERMLRVDFGQVDRLAQLVGEQTIREAELLRQVLRMQEGIDALGRRIGERRVADAAAADALHQYLSAASNNLAIMASGIEGASRDLDMVSGSLQRCVLDMRLVRLDSVFEKHRLTVFQAAGAQGKKARLEIVAGDAKLDKSLAEKLEEPMLHLVRNAVSHGIAKPEARAAAGKVAEGRITIRAFQQGNQVVVRVEDDGDGIRPDVIRAKATEKGFLTAAEAASLDDGRIVDLIFAPGFSTTNAADGVSGRGVGLDVVRTHVNRMGGAVEVFSKLGEGTAFQLTLPLTLALSRVLLVRAGGQTLAIPADAVVRTQRVPHAMLSTVESRTLATVEEQAVPFVRLAESLDLARVRHVRTDYLVCIVSHAGKSVALCVDRVLEHTQAVVRETGPALPTIPCCMGVTFQEAQCVLIVDAGALVREWFDAPAPPAIPQARSCIVSDDVEALPGLLAWSRRRAGMTPVFDSGSAAAIPESVSRVYVDAALAGLHAVLRELASRSPRPDVILLAEPGASAALPLDQLYDLGVADILAPSRGFDAVFGWSDDLQPGGDRP